jgi:hypothetical protein
VTNFAISAAVLCYGTAAVPIGPRLVVIWTDSVRPARIVRQIVLLLAVSSVQPLLACDSGTTSGGLRHALQLVAKLTEIAGTLRA